MPTITLIERPAAGDETELRASSSHWSPGDQLFIVERVWSNGTNNSRTAVGLRLMCRSRRDDRGMVSAPPATSEAVAEGVTTS